MEKEGFVNVGVFIWFLASQPSCDLHTFQHMKTVILRGPLSLCMLIIAGPSLFLCVQLSWSIYIVTLNIGFILENTIKIEYKYHTIEFKFNVNTIQSALRGLKISAQHCP